MTSPVNIANLHGRMADMALSPSLVRSLQTPRSFARRMSANQGERHLKPFESGDIKVLLLENINQSAVQILMEKGYQVEQLESSLPEEELIERIKNVQVIGIRSKTRLTASVLQHARNLLVIGCFCIGTNQVDLQYAAEKGIAVFNSPFSNSRSVAELVIGYIIMLARQLGDRSIELHSGTWNKVSSGCWEIRGKTLGIVGYGHIGSQLSVLAESMGMQVLYYDALNIMALGSACQMGSLSDLLARSDFVSLHVPELPETKNMISREQFAVMKDGSYLINASRGSVVDIEALIEARKSGKIAGCALDVYPNEPGKNGPDTFVNSLNAWTSELVSLRNVVLTPHIGGSTIEAQRAIGVEVAHALSTFINEGSSVSSVNFPEVDLRQPMQGDIDSVRVLYIHQNVPGALRTVNEIFGEYNITKQFTDSQGPIAYLMADISDVAEKDIHALHEELNRTPANIRTRMLY